MTQQSDRQASVRAVTGTSLTYEGDFEALFDAASIAKTDFNGRLLAWINSNLSASYTEINGAMQALAVANGAFNFSSMGTFNPGSIAGSAATSIASMGTTPAVHYHFPTATITTASGRMTAVVDRMGLADISDAGAGAGPFDHTDTQGLRCANFQGAEWAAIANGLVTASQAITVFMVMRVPNVGSDTVKAFISQGRNGDGKATTGQATIGMATGAGKASHIVPNNLTTKNAVGHADVVLGAQIQVVGVASRPNASGGQRCYLNTKTADVGEMPVSIAGFQGMEIGRWAFSPGSTGSPVTGIGGNYGEFDLYELIVFTGVLTNTQAGTIAAAISSNWDTRTITDQVILEGDSLTAGVRITPGSANQVLNWQSLGAVLSDRGSAWCLPRTTRVLNCAVSSSKMADVISRRDSLNSPFGELLPGYNRLAVHIGTNDALLETGAQMYADSVAMWNTTSTGFLQRGWSCWDVLNVARSDSSTQNQHLLDKRPLIRAAQFLIDCAADPGNTFDGKLKRIELPNIVITGGNKPFDQLADVTANLALYNQGDGLHESPLAVTAWASGATTPTNGYFSALS